MIKNCFILSLFLFAGLFSASADITIGNGFSCDGTSIIKGTRTIPYSRAKSTIAATIEKLKEKLAEAPKKKKEGIREKIQAANSSKTLLRACSKGELKPGEVDQIFTQLAAGTGTYTGTYSGTVDGFLPLSGPITFQFVLDQTTFSTLLTIGGNVGNALNAKPLSFSSDVGGIALPAQFNLPDTFLGSVTLSVAQDGHLTVTNTGSPKASVNMDGQFASQAITGQLGGTYSGHTFSGSFTLNRE